MPESVARTTTPIVTSTNVSTTVAVASFWKRVKESPGAAARRRESGGRASMRILP
jgi:hypothetical protein